MTEYLVEAYVARAAREDVTRIAATACSVASEMTREGTPVRYVRSMFVAEDEMCFYVFEAESRDAVAEASRRANLAFERIVEAA